MPRLIKDGAVIEDVWVLLDKDGTLSSALAHESGHIIVPISLWLENRKELAQSGKQVGVWLDSDEEPDSLRKDIDSLPLIALNFPSFRDGRAYSSAAILRQRLNYQRELRAIGEVLRDQLFYMKKCGFDSFNLNDEVKIEDALTAFSDFSTNYQSTVENPLPLFRRR